MISDKLSKILGYKADIKSAIERKLGVVSITNKLSDWAGLIESIKLEEKDIEPEEELVQDEYTHIWFLPTSNTGVQSFQIGITGETVIDWGDGSSDTLTESGLQFASHIYSGIPIASTKNEGIGCINYTIVEIKVYSEYDYWFEGQGATPDATMTKSNIPAFNTITSTMVKFIASDNCLVKNWGFAACNSLSRIKLSERQSELYSGCFSYFRGMLKFDVPDHIKIINNVFGQSQGINEIVLHDSIERLEGSALSGLSIREVEIPSSVKYIGSGCFSNCKHLKKVVWKSPYQYIQSSCFSGCYNLRILDLSYAVGQMYFGTSVNTTGTSGNIAVIPGETKIIVHKSLYNAWKSNARWIYFKNYLYWRDEDGNLNNTEVVD